MPWRADVWLSRMSPQCLPSRPRRMLPCRERAPLRAGYMGHLTEIANSLVSVAARRPAVAEALLHNNTWTDFAFGPLSQRNNVRAQSPLFHCCL